MNEKILRVGDYVPNGLISPPWGDGTYRVFKLSRVVGTMEDKMEDEIRDFPEGEQHDDQVDAIPFPDIETPMRLRRWFNVLMLIVNIVVAIMLLLVIPAAVGFTLLGAPVIFWDWLRMWFLGTIGLAGVFVAAFYFGMIFNETRKSIRRNIALIRKNVR